MFHNTRGFEKQMYLFDIFLSTMKKILFLVLFTAAFAGCTDSDKPDVSHVKKNTSFKRFDQAFFEIDSNKQVFYDHLPALRSAFPHFFMSNETSRFFYLQRKEEMPTKLYAEVQAVLGDLEEENEALNDALKHVYHYFGSNKTYQPYTYISNLDYDYPILLADSVIFVATDLYLGVECPYYAGLPTYLRFYRQPSFMVRDIIESIALSKSVKPKQERLIDDMVFHGKLLYFIHLMMPDVAPEIIVRYTSDDLAFCAKNEKSIWAYFIENNLLFDTSLDTKRRFVDTAPFSKFRTKFDNNTPGMIAKWVGYRLISSYAEKHPDMTIAELMQQGDTDKILKLSGYKP
jgi:hypothetical protein